MILKVNVILSLCFFHFFYFKDKVLTMDHLTKSCKSYKAQHYVFFYGLNFHKWMVDMIGLS